MTGVWRAVYDVVGDVFILNNEEKSKGGNFIMNKLKIAACGIDCNGCGSYKVTMEQDINAAES